MMATRERKKIFRCSDEAQRRLERMDENDVVVKRLSAIDI